MLLSYTSLSDYPVMSLHVGGEIARLKEPIIDPNDMSVIGYVVDGSLIRGEVGNILSMRDVREFANIGAIIDSTDALSHREDVIKIDKIMSLNFHLIGHKVVTKKGTKLGRVVDFTLNPDTFLIQQLVVKRPAVKAFLDPELLIGRSQIAEVDDERVVVKDEEAKIRAQAEADFKQNFVNPFRQQRLATADNQSLDGQGN